MNQTATYETPANVAATLTEHAPDIAALEPAPDYIGTATYSPEDNKLRITPFARLDRAVYDRIKAAGYGWAPKQGIFVAPMWTPGRHDIALELCGDIADEDTTLCERAEERAERFEDYSEKRADDATRAAERVQELCDGVPFGQPILVGHHSERHARRTAKQIEQGTRRAVNMWETSEYWTRRAAGAVRSAKYKDKADVRARRIKGLEADRRKQERNRAEAVKALSAWSAEGLTLEQALHIAGYGIGNLTVLMVNADGTPNTNGGWSAYDVLSPEGKRYAHCSAGTIEQCQAAAERTYPRRIAWADRWIAHYTNRIDYERAQLEEQGASELLAPTPRSATRAALPLCNYQLPDGLTLPHRYHRGETEHLPMVVMTKAEYAAVYADYRGTRIVTGSHRVRVAMLRTDGQYGMKTCMVFLSDSKTHEPPAAADPTPAPAPVAAPHMHVVPVDAPREDPAAPFKAMKEALRTGAAVQVAAVNQLFPTPNDIAARMFKMLDVRPGHSVLEPSAGTGALLGALGSCMFEEGAPYPVPYRERNQLQAVEINRALCNRLETEFPLTAVLCADFLDVEPACEGGGGLIIKTLGRPFYDRIIMNPPFENGADIKHIQHARKFLATGGRIVAICANGPRQAAALRDIADSWEILPAGTFAGTNVSTVLLTINN